MKLTEKRYIAYRKMVAIFSSIPYWVCHIFKIRNNKIVFSAFEGMGYCCNPKYIAKEIIEREKIEGKKYELVWLVNDITKDFPCEINVVKNTLLNRAYHLSTAKIWVDNARKNYGTIKRKEQYYILTWHGMIGFKPVGRLRGESFPRIAEIVSKWDAKNVDALLSNSTWCTNVWKEAFWNENIIKVGSPRCDILLNGRKDYYQKVRQRLNISVETKIMIYAPTFRGGSQGKKRKVESSVFSLDFNLVLKSLSEKFGGQWVILLRLHPQLALQMKNAKVYEEKNIIDISNTDDLYEILVGADAFITDYSSAAFDAAIMQIPVLIYADDLEEYIGDRGKLLWNISEIPFLLSRNNYELKRNIEEFDYEKYQEIIKKFFDEIELFEDGNASKRIVDMIDKIIKS